MKGRVRDRDIGDETVAWFAVGANAASSEPADVHIVDRKPIDAVVRASPESDDDARVSFVCRVSHEDEVVDDDVHAGRRVLRINGDPVGVRGNGGPGTWVQ